ncbi:hypothetical protein [Cohnella thailandensis]|uniref:Uncharacterized protein n=1 Tax=Cohnella thailandensis TaxID=557557 RepID=A0A841SPI8_9BACL|nr:hypothetical protein [Cohnella thailandensis]MBB6634353.1 hypothetical protein [Cohnella thailandensis]MBP1972148.1 hypothetical protein [Cohnella thailandensis]
MNLPHRFDVNEWFILIASVLLYTLIFFLPKRFPISQSIFIWLFNLYTANFVDFMIATEPLDLYQVNDGPDYELFDLLIYVMLYAPTAYLVIYLFDRWRPMGVKAALYLGGWALATTGLEEIAELCHVFEFSGWRHLYSIPVYALVYGLNLILFRMLRLLYTGSPKRMDKG